MTQDTIERLDYSKPPPGYRVSPPEDDGLSFADHAEAMSDCWMEYKAEHDPPGMEVFCWPKEKASDPPTAWCVALRGKVHFAAFTEPEPDACRPNAETEARMVAWAWHDRRHALAARIETGEEYGQDLPWPRCLTWTDEQVAEVERWLTDSTAEMPEVLRG